jgi:hypothetical protein
MTRTLSQESLDYVNSLPRRVAHVVHALLEGSGPCAFGMGALKPSEVMLYDGEALTVSATNNALQRAMRDYELVDRGGWGIYFPTQRAYNNREAFEDRYLRETGGDHDH